MWGQRLFQTWGSLNREQPVTKALPFPSCTTKIFSPSTWTGRKSAGWSYTGRRLGKQALSVSLNCNPCKIKFSSLSSLSLCLSLCVCVSLSSYYLRSFTTICWVDWPGNKKVTICNFSLLHAATLWTRPTTSFATLLNELAFSHCVLSNMLFKEIKIKP